MEELPWQMRVMHEWYMKASKMGLSIISTNVLENTFTSRPNGILIIDFKDLHTFFKLDKIDINLIVVFCLQRVEVATYMGKAMLKHQDKNVIMVPYTLT
uniref:Uncharacterized protein n=1 Tax=Oryza punctata TaxID=4537 RepID=A0A0E0M012_ORYPU